MTWFVYLIRCSNGSLYTGVTTDVTRRFNEHSAQGKKTAKYLRGKAPLSLIGYIESESRSAAQKLEFKIKKLSKQKKLDLFVKVRENKSIINKSVYLAIGINIEGQK